MTNRLLVGAVCFVLFRSVLVPLEVTIEVIPRRDIAETDACEEPSSSR